MGMMVRCNLYCSLQYYHTLTIFVILVQYITEKDVTESFGWASLDASEDDPSNKVLVDSSSPLWVCKNAMRTHMTCVFAWCNPCYSKKTTSRRRTKKARSDHEENKCHHDLQDLDSWTDKAYFTSAYKAQVEENGEFMPIVCRECKRKLVSQISVWTSMKSNCG